MTIAIINEKGGVGKTTLALNLSAKLALDGDKVLLLDADPQNSTAVFCEKRTQAQIDPLFVTMQKIGDSLNSEIKLASNSFDDIVIDTGGRDSKEMRKALLSSDIVIVPTSASALDTKAIEYVIKVIGDAKEFNENLIAYIVINKATTNTFLSQDLDRLRAQLGDIIKDNKDIYLLNNAISDRISYKRSIADGLSIQEYIDDKAKIEFDTFYKEFESSVKSNLGV